MKIKYISLFLLAIGLMVSSCSKKDNPQPEEENLKNGVTATITLPDGEKVHYKGVLLMNFMVWSKDKEDGNILSIIATDKGFNNATLTFGISYADGPGTYSLAPTELMANPAKLIWDGMEWDNWMGYVTGDADGDHDADGSGTFTIEVLNEKQARGTFSMTMGNDLGSKITVTGKFSGPVMRQIEP